MNHHADIDVQIKNKTIFGFLFIFLGFGSFLIWAFYAPINQGVPGYGIVRISGERKEVQSLAGGSIGSILVREGDDVIKDQIIVKLNKTQAEAQKNIVFNQWFIAYVTQVRLQAEKNNLKKISWSSFINQIAEKNNLKKYIELQEQQFTTRKSEFLSSIEIQNRNIDGLKEQLQGQVSIKENHSLQKKLLLKELEGLQLLANDGFLAKNRLLEAQRGVSQIEAQISEDISNVGKLKQDIHQGQLKIILIEQTYRKDIENEISDTSKEISALDERLKSAQFDVDHTDIKAPVSGHVVDLRIHTEGGVVSPGQHLMDIVPINAPLIIEAKFSALVLDKLIPGLKVDVHFSGLNRLETPQLEGVVKTVSADQLIDETTRQPYFNAEIHLTDLSLKELRTNNITVKPGMPADVVVVTGERTLINYLLKPLNRRVLSSLKED